MKEVNKERLALLGLREQVRAEDQFCPMCIHENKGFFVLCCSAFTLLSIGIILIIIRVPEVRPNLPTDIIINGWVTLGKSQPLSSLRVNLDDSPENRWASIGQKYRKFGHRISEAVRIIKQSQPYSELMRSANGSSFQSLISDYANSTFLIEIKSYAKHLDVSYDDLVIFNLLYQYHSYNDISVVPDDRSQVWQRIYHASTISSINAPEFNVKIYFFDKGKLLFKTLSVIGLVGTSAGVRLKKFSLSLSLKFIQEEKCKVVKKSSVVSSLAVRQILSQMKSYEEAFKYLSNSDFEGNFVLGGVNAGDAIVIKNLCSNDTVLLSSQAFRKENPVYTLQMTASQPTRFAALSWIFDM